MHSQPSFSRPIYLLRIEAFCVLFAASGAYHRMFPHHWVIFACLFLVPDLSLLTYLRGPSITASIAYNVMHSYVLPALLGVLSVSSQREMLGQMSLIWIGHIGMDRMLGYGLKYTESFQFTHIQSATNPVIVPTLAGRSR